MSSEDFGSSRGGFRSGGGRGKQSSSGNSRFGQGKGNQWGRSGNDRNGRKNFGDRRRDDRDGGNWGRSDRDGQNNRRDGWKGNDRGMRRNDGDRRGFGDRRRDDRDRGGWGRSDRDRRGDDRRQDGYQRKEGWRERPREYAHGNLQGNRHHFGVRDARGRAKAWRQEHELEIPANVKASDLDPETLTALKSLEKAGAEIVAKHLVMAGSLLDVDPEAAYEHAQAAVSRAGRIAQVREAAALAAYTCGKYQEALREVRTARRLSGSDLLRAVEADCERGLGHPDKALNVIEETNITGFEVEEIAELILVAAGARADMQQYQTALAVLDDFLTKYQPEEPECLARILMMKVDILRDLGRLSEADQVEAEIPAIPDSVTIMDLEEVLEADNPHVSSDLKGSRETLLERYQTLVLDLDGVCYMGTESVPFAAQGLAAARSAGLKFTFVTNNASRTPEEVAAKLQKHGIECASEEVMTAAMDAVGILENKLPPGSKVLVVGGEGLRAPVAAAGFEIVTEAEQRPAAVVQGFAEDVSWKELAQATYAINAGAFYVATNIDATLPTEKGFAPGNGSLVQAVVHATGKEPFAAGKPFAQIYRKALELVSGENPLSVGDRLDTDIAGARAAGIPSVHVLTGVSDAKAICLALPDQRPTFLACDLRDLAAPHPGPVKQPTELWTCGDSDGFGVDEDGQIWWQDRALTDSVTLSLNNYRALVAAVWEARDKRIFVHVPNIKVEPNSSVTPVDCDSTVEDKIETDELDGPLAATVAAADNEAEVVGTSKVAVEENPETQVVVEAEDLADLETEVMPELETEATPEEAETVTETATDVQAEKELPTVTPETTDPDQEETDSQSEQEEPMLLELPFGIEK